MQPEQEAEGHWRRERVMPFPDVAGLEESTRAVGDSATATGTVRSIDFSTQTVTVSLEDAEGEREITVPTTRVSTDM